MRMKLNQKDFEIMAEQVEGEIREDYSGRGMYGDTCPAIVIDSYSSYTNLTQLGVAILSVLIYWAEDDDEKDQFIDMAERIAKMSRTDSMGLGTVIYFPGLELV